MTKVIELIVSPSGETRLETKGLAGSSCQTASQFLEKALGITKSQQLTADFYQQEAARHPHELCECRHADSVVVIDSCQKTEESSSS